jgi:type IV secretory pathway VirB6-like protein
MDNFSSSDMTGVVSNVLEALDVSGRDMIMVLGGVNGLGFQLLSVLLTVMFLYHVIIFMLEGNGRVMVDITKLAFTWMFLASMLGAWTSPGTSGGVMKDISVSGFFLNSIPGIANKFTKGQNATEIVVDKHVVAMGNAFKVLLKEQQYEPKPDEGLSSKILNYGKNLVLEKLQWAFMVEDAVGLIISSVILIVAAGFILWSLLTFVFVLNAGQVMLYIGLALGPLLIPFLLIPNLSFLFNGWLRFMISAALYKIIAVLVALLALGTIDQVATYSSSMATKDESIIFLSLMVLFFAMLGKQLMGLADNMSSSLATGGSNSGGAGDSSKLVMFAGRMGGGGGKSAGKASAKEGSPNTESNSPVKPKPTAKKD